MNRPSKITRSSLAAPLVADIASSPCAVPAASYDHVSFEDHSWIADEEFISDWGPYGLCDTDLGVRATTLRKLGATTSRSLILDKPLCSGCDQVIVGNVCHNCEVVFHRDEPEPFDGSSWLRAERSAMGMGK